jgi:hypothetical protein
MHPLKIMLCVLLALLLSGCIPIGVRGSSLYTAAPASHAG